MQKYTRNIADVRRIFVQHLRRSMFGIIFESDLVQDVDLVLLCAFNPLNAELNPIYHFLAY
jgi:hypothetical protein